VGEGESEYQKCLKAFNSELVKMKEVNTATESEFYEQLTTKWDSLI
jgi:hypothetical protein